MKNIKQHIEADLYLLGYSNPTIHSILDSNVKYFGPAHRFDNHDFRTVKAIDYFYGDKAGDIALLHIILDLHIINDKLVMKIIKKIKEERNNDKDE